MTVLVLGELRDVTLCSAISPSWTVLVVGTGLMGRGTHQVSPVYCTVSCSEGPGAPIWNYGHLSVIISCFYEVFMPALLKWSPTPSCALRFCRQRKQLPVLLLRFLYGFITVSTLGYFVCCNNKMHI